MSGRIATAIRTDVATLGDYRSRVLLGDRRNPPGRAPNEDASASQPASAQQTESLAATSASLLAAAGSSGAAFTAAVVAGALPTVPRQHLGSTGGQAWAPPDSDLHLTDRRV